MDTWIVWLIVALLLIIIEVLTQMVWTICLAVGCVGAIVAYFAGADLAWQIIVLAGVSVLAFLVLMPVFKRWHDGTGRSADCLTGMVALPGRRATVTESIEPGQMGRARIDGDNWQVRAPGVNHAIEAGSEVVVTSYDGNILDVVTLDRDMKQV